MATLASLVVRISGNTAQLNKSVAAAETRLDTFKKKGSASLKAIGTAAAGLAVAGAAAITGFGVSMVKSLIDTEKELRRWWSVLTSLPSPFRSLPRPPRAQAQRMV